MDANFAKRRRIKSPRGLDADVKTAVEGNFHLELKITKQTQHSKISWLAQLVVNFWIQLNLEIKIRGSNTMMLDK